MSASRWSEEENQRIVADYFRMLELQQRGVPFKKAVHNLELRRELNGRSRGSVEFKHQNISAALHDMGLPFVDGYWPASNYQASLVASIEGHLRGGHVVAALERQIQRVEVGRYPKTADELWRRRVGVPQPIVRERPEKSRSRPRLGLKFDFAERDAANRRLGELGEKFVVDAERQRLRHANEHKLADAVEWSSHERGDGLGYDVRSFDEAGEEIFIEVKTTNIVNSAFPFLITPNEVAVSAECGGRYRLFRLFSFTIDPRFYVLAGAITKTCLLESKLFSAQPRPS